MKRKAVFGICIMMIIMIAFTGCTSIMVGKTKKYRTYKTFYKYHKIGMDKEEVLDTIGCPASYKDEEGTWHSLPYKNREDFVKNISSDSSLVWIYECYEFPDPANPYRLKITFDSEGKSESVEFEIVYGG